MIRVAGLPWFHRDDYESFRAVLPDRAWHRSYDEWLAAAKLTKQRIERDGIVAVEAQVRSQDFVDWCAATGRHVNTQALLDFANEAAMRVHAESGTH